MSDSSPNPLFLDENPAAVPFPRILQQTYIWVLSMLCGIVTVALLVFAVATQSSGDAERIADMKGRSSMSSLVGALAVTYGRPGRF
ncbi:hypothetical protein [Methylobacterium sp. 77]|uniref:hypothetical protein n=1 Tax=Methylobacterium sp. 77 TaxID=1101192 RepID=UPI0012DCC61E|nr:hypothetical protein [Methylobacterium sp. 77]